MNHETFNSILDHAMGLPSSVPLPDSSTAVPFFYDRGSRMPFKTLSDCVFLWNSDATTTDIQLPSLQSQEMHGVCIWRCGERWRVLKTVIATDLGYRKLAALVLHNTVLTLETDNHLKKTLKCGKKTK
ncbi:hypothetical protein PoB_004155700 [Plakobranchus ocellatus]|uniref:Uncharacterized protein n=1 Tax=Plakobranchus ocellatus TaxID=259542 RepID=A0AAV4B6A8_9GAST|nr:hypothetical protein PoB_004155700 [Plakobranchus ocellatus]